MPERRFRDGVLAVALPAFAAGLLAALLYWRASSFGFFNDDPTGHFAWMEGRSLWDFFRSSADYGYYRPIVFAVLRLMETLFGGAPGVHDPVADHLLLILLHAANTGMVWLLARQLGGRAAFAWVAALVFAAVPFSYEAVAYVASLTHPLLVFWLLLTLLLYDHVRASDHVRTSDHGRASGSGRKVYLIAAWLTMSLGLLTHENGLFILPALVGLEWVRRAPPLWRGFPLRPLLPFVVPPMLFAALWLSVPKNSDSGLRALSEIARNAVPFLQTLVYPLLPVLRLESGDVAWLLAAAVALLLLTGYLAFAAAALRLWAYGLGWFVLSSLPSMLFLSPDYLYGSPRLSYLPSIGVAMLWGIPVLWLWRWAESRRGRGPLRSLPLRVVLTVGFVALLVAPPLPFIRCQLEFYDETTRIVRQMAERAGSVPTGQEVVFVNLPYFFSSYAAHPDGCPNPYPWTPVGAVVVPPYARARDFVRFNGGPDRPVAGVGYAGYGPGWKVAGEAIDDEGLRAAAADDAVFVYDLNRGGFFDLSAAWQPGGAVNYPTLATFGGLLELAAASTTDAADRLTTILNWRVAAAPDGPLTTFIHVYDAAGALVAQSDAPLAGGYAPVHLMRAGDGLADVHTIELGVLPPGEYRVALGVYRSADGQRLPAYAGGATLADDVFTVATVRR